MLRNPGDKLEVASVNDVEVCVVKLPKTYPNSLEHSDQGSELVLLTVLSFLGKNLYKYIYCIPSSLLKPKISLASNLRKNGAVFFLLCPIVWFTLTLNLLYLIFEILLGSG